MKDQFVSYELALKLKELGFDEKCFATYRKDAVVGNPFEYNLDYHTKVQLDHNLCPKNSEYVNDWISAPLWQQAFDWFREEQRLHFEISINILDQWYFSIYNINEKRNSEVKPDKEYFEDHKEARKYCLEKLIEIVKEL